MVRLITGPKVYLVSYTMVDWEAISRLLADEGLPPASESIRAYAGSTYKKDGTTEPYSLATIEVAARLCFDDATEILSERGWISLSQITAGEKVLTSDPSSLRAEWEVPKAIYHYEYEGVLFGIHGRDVDFLVTPEHRQFVRPDRRAMYAFAVTESLVGKRGIWVRTAASGWKGYLPTNITVPVHLVTQRISNGNGTYGSHTFPRGRGYCWESPGEILAVASLLTYYATEGSLGAGKGISISGSHVEEVFRLCAKLELPHKSYVDPRNQYPRVAVGGGAEFRSFVEAACGKYSPNKRLPGWVLNLPTVYLSEIWRILVRTDGHTYASGREVLVTTSPTLAGQAQEILLKLGFSSRVSVAGASKNYPLLMVGRKNRQESRINMNAHIVPENYKGMVHCVSTRNRLVWVRRNGIPHLSGNCYMSFGRGRKDIGDFITNLLSAGDGSVFEHVNYGFCITGISRSLSHEFVRHRAGFAYSQRSQRFVDEAECAFVVPPAILNVVPGKIPTVQQSFERYLNGVVEAYDGLTGALANLTDPEHRLPTTDRRKAVRSASRSVLPNATETKMFVTANVRAWRHFIGMRATTYADLEIRRLAIAILRILQEREPLLFGDFVISQHVDGTEIATPKYWKV